MDLVKPTIILFNILWHNNELIQHIFYDSKNMWQRSTVQFKRITPNTSVFYASCAYSNTYLIATYQITTFKFMLMHIDHKGNILFQKDYPIRPDAKIKMLSDKQVVIFHRQSKVFELLNLKTYKTQYFTTPNTPVMSNAVQLFVFPETKLVALAIVEAIFPGTFPATINYFNTENQNQALCFQFKLDNKCKSCAVDLHSKIAIFNKTQMAEFEFLYFTIKDNPNKQLKKIKLKSGIQVSDIIGVSTFTLERQWEIRPNIYWFAASYTQGDAQAFFVDYFEKDCIVDVSECQTEAEIRKHQIKCVQKPEKIYMNILKDSLFIRVVRQGCQKKSKYTLSLVQNDNEEVVSCCSINVNNGVSIEAALSLIVSYQRKDTSYLQVVRLAMEHTRKNISMFFLLHLNEDFDDDLLQDAIELLP